jgi:hypothetical protein
MLIPDGRPPQQETEIMREGEHRGHATSSRTAPAVESQSDEGPVIQPLPWEIGPEGYIVDANGIMLSMLTSDEKRLIVRCVNSHDALLAALKDVTEHLESQRDFQLGNGDAEEYSARDRARAAIAKAEGRS